MALRAPCRVCGPLSCPSWGLSAASPRCFGFHVSSERRIWPLNSRINKKEAVDQGRRSKWSKEGNPSCLGPPAQSRTPGVWGRGCGPGHTGLVGALGPGRSGGRGAALGQSCRSLVLCSQGPACRRCQVSCSEGSQLPWDPRVPLCPPARLATDLGCSFPRAPEGCLHRWSGGGGFWAGL